MTEPRSILVFRNGSIGNTMVAIPALRALRLRWPRATLAVVVDKSGFELLEHCPWIDHLIVYDKRGADRGLWAGLRLIKRLRTFRPTHAVLFKRFFRNGLLAYCSGARERVGFRTNGRAPFLTRTVDYAEAISVLDLDLKLAALLDAGQTDRRTELFLSDADRAQARAWLTEQHIAGLMAVIHYGGQTTRPDFIDTPNFARFLQSLLPNYSLVFVGHGASELAAAHELISQCGRGAAAVNLPLRVMAGLLECANVFVGMNSGPAHLAAAAGVRGVVLYPGSSHVSNELIKWKPASPALKQVVIPLSAGDAELRALIADLSHDVNAATGLG